MNWSPDGSVIVPTEIRPKAVLRMADEGKGFPMTTASIQIWNSFPHCDEKHVHLWLLSGHYPGRHPVGSGFEQGLIGDLGVDVLLKSQFASKLEILDLKNNDLSDKSVIALSKSENLKQLISLNLSKNNITDDGAKALARSTHLGKLKKLDLNFNRIGDEGAFAIAESKSLSNLESLKLGQNKIGTEGTRVLNQSKTLQNLVHPIFGFY